MNTTAAAATRYPASPPPLSDRDAYTTWPGGVDPTARVYDSVGGRRRRNRTRKVRKAKRGGSRKSCRKATRRHRRATRRHRRA